MFGDTTSRLTRKIIIVVLLIGGSAWLGRSTTRALLVTGERVSLQQSPTVIITPQPGAPLQIISTWVESGKPENFRLVAQVQNQSNKGIRAYTINSLTTTSKRQNGTSQFMNLTQASIVWQPTEIRAVELADSQQEQINTARLTFDFVEFEDGTTWGPDKENSRDMLAGQRAGAKLERQRLREIMEAKGPEAIALDIKIGNKSEVETAISAARSRQWIEGFHNGVVSVRRRVSSAVASGSKEQIKSELDRSFDTSKEDHK